MLQDILQFASQNWYLWALFFVLLAAVAWFETRTVVGGILKVDIPVLVSLMNHDNATVLDIRDADAYKEGHIVGSVNVPNDELADKNKKLQRFKAKPVVVICANGHISLKVAQKLKQEGFEKLYSLKGGMATWKAASLPVDRS